MTKRILSLLGATIAMAFIASCQNQGTTTTTSTPAQTHTVKSGSHEVSATYDRGASHAAPPMSGDR